MGMFDDIYNTLKNQRYGAGLDRPSGNPIGQWIQGVTQRTMHPLETMASESERWRKMPTEEMLSNVSPGGMLGGIAYHGSPHIFSKFDMNSPKSTGGSFNRYGVSVSPNKNVAERYGQDFSIGGEHGSVYKVETNLRNPLNLEGRDFHKLQQLVGKLDSGNPLSESSSIDLEMLLKKYGINDTNLHPMDAIRKAGFDGLTNTSKIRGGSNAEVEHLIFNPENIDILERKSLPLRDTTYEPPLFPDTTR